MSNMTTVELVNLDHSGTCRSISSDEFLKDAQLIKRSEYQVCHCDHCRGTGVVVVSGKTKNCTECDGDGRLVKITETFIFHMLTKDESIKLRTNTLVLKFKDADFEKLRQTHTQINNITLDHRSNYLEELHPELEKITYKYYNELVSELQEQHNTLAKMQKDSEEDFFS